ncbi:MAG: tRNA glutamyl-Q(34) synthetase GluQRS [Gemmataceae bacterium]
MNVVGRLAPSPTGAQHVGNARTYVIAWLSARSRGGRLLLRLEDIDSPRVRAGAATQTLDDLRWLGLDWDEGPVVQTERLSLYQEALCRLRAHELVYPCTCSRGDIERAASAPHADHDSSIYPGTCTHRRATDAAALADRAWAWRLRVPMEIITFNDSLRGSVSLDLETLGDVVVWKSSGTPAYQLAVVVDDAAMGITEVVRGDDLIPSTPWQVVLYRMLELRAPAWCHVPLVVGPDGRRLAKRHGDTKLSSLRAAGVRPEALLGLLAWSCGWLETYEPIRLPELLPLFRLETIPPHPFVLEPRWLEMIGFSV